MNINRNNYSVPVHPPNLPFHPSGIHISSHPSVLSLSLLSLFHLPIITPIFCTRNPQHKQRHQTNIYPSEKEKKKDVYITYVPKGQGRKRGILKTFKSRPATNKSSPTTKIEHHQQTGKSKTWEEMKKTFLTRWNTCVYNHPLLFPLY